MGCPRTCRERRKLAEGKPRQRMEKELYFLFGVGEFEKRVEVVFLFFFFLLAFLF